MKKQVILLAIISLLVAVAGISAQEKAKAPAPEKKIDFSGSWELDASKSKLGERMRVESMTMNVSHTDKELKIESTTKRAMRAEGEMRGGGANFGRGGGFGDGPQTTTYSLDGKETKTEIPGIPSATLKAKWEKDGKLQLSSIRSFETPMGVMSTSTKETWSLSEDGKTLTVKRETETPRGTMNTEMVFVKK